MISKIGRRYFSLLNGFQSRDRDFPYNFDPSFDPWKRLEDRFTTEKGLIEEISSKSYETQKIREFYKILVDSFLKMDVRGLKPYLEEALFKKFERELLELKHEKIKICHTTSMPSTLDQNILQNVFIRHIGSLRVYNVSLLRKENGFIHQYDTKREKEFLEYNLKDNLNQHQQNKALLSKEEKLKQEIKQMAEKGDSRRKKLSDIFVKVSDTLGLGFKKGKENFDVPNVVKSFSDYRTNLHKTLIERPHILVEDFEITSYLGFYLKNLVSGEEFGETDKEKINRHFVRIERAFDAKEAPSIRKTKPFKISDFDFVMMGNPHALVRDFTL